MATTDSILEGPSRKFSWPYPIFGKQKDSSGSMSTCLPMVNDNNCADLEFLKLCVSRPLYEAVHGTMGKTVREFADQVRAIEVPKANGFGSFRPYEGVVDKTVRHRFNALMNEKV
jgi:hypothetical protein